MGAPLDTGLRIAAAALAWLAGIGWQMQQPVLWPPARYILLCATALAALLLWRHLTVRTAAPGGARLQAASIGCLMLALALLGFGSTGWRATVRLAQALPAALEGRELQLVGVIARMPQLGAQGTRFVFDVEQATLDGSPAGVPPRVALGWYRGFEGEGLIGDAPPDLRAGQRWLLTARLRQPHGSLNPQGFDLELWLFEQGIRASGTVRAQAGSAMRLLAESAAHPIERARQRVRDAILLRVDDPQAAGVLAALAVGDQAAIERDDWELFRHTGVAHLMSISGLHVTMFAWLAALALGPLWRRSPRLMLWCPAPTAARWGGVLAAGAYALLAGWGVPAQRTLWMLASVVLLRTLGLRWPQALVLLAAAAVVTALDPWAVMQPGFWLSFAAVGMLMASEPQVAAVLPVPAVRRRDRLWAAVRAGLRTQAVASIGLAPLSMVFFQQVSLVGFVANLLAIPLVTLLITPLALLGVLLPPLWAAASMLVQGLVAWLGWLAGWPFGVWTAAAAPAWGVASGLLGGLLLLLPLPWRLRLLGLPLLLPLAAPPLERPREGSFEAVVADVGQGTAVLLRTRAHLLLYDAGPRYAADADAAQRVLLPLLRARGEGAIDLLLLSHGDSDHVGGAAALLAQRRVRALMSSLPESHPLLGHGLPHRGCQAGQSWQWDGVRFEILHPPADAAPPRKPNALSCVLRVQGQDGRSLLLTGDIEAAQEAALLARAGAALRSQVLLVPHHGSRTSSTEDFVLAVAPGTALVQAGYRNRFGHPTAEVVARYQSLGVELLRSDACGAWSWDARGTRCEREQARRYWHHRAAGSP